MMEPKNVRPIRNSSKLAAGELYRTIVLAMNGEDGGLLPDFPTCYKLIEPAPGVKLVVTVGEGDVIEEVNAEKVVNCITQYTIKELGGIPAYAFTYRQSLDCMRFWRSATKSIPSNKVEAFRWSDEPGFTFHRLPWPKGVTGPTPTWDTLLNGFSNKEAIKCFFGSLFFEDSNNQQYLWIYGTGNDGKGSLNRFLARVFGNSYASKSPPMRGDKFWTHGLLNKRLIVFPDCNNQSFITSGLFKSITGGDVIGVEAKGQMAFSVLLICKLLILSNGKPAVSSEKSDRRRLIYSEAKDRQEDLWEKDFEPRLWAEGGAFLSSCIALYLEKCPNREPIKADHTEIEEHIQEEVEVSFHEILSANFFISFDGQDSIYWLTPIELERKLKPILPQYYKRMEFRNWLERVHGIKKKTVREATGFPKKLIGLKAKDEIDQHITSTRGHKEPQWAY